MANDEFTATRLNREVDNAIKAVEDSVSDPIVARGIIALFTIELIGRGITYEFLDN